MSGRRPPSEVTPQLERLLRRVASSDKELVRLIDRVWVFGSYRRGAPMVGDVDLVATFDAAAPAWRRIENELRKQWEDRWDYWNSPKEPTWRIRRALGIGRTAISVEFIRTEDRLDAIPGQPFRDRLLLWERGDPFETAHARLRAIREDPCADRHKAEVTDKLRWLDGLVARSVAVEIAACVAVGSACVSELVIPPGEPMDERTKRSIAERWRSPQMARQRAAAMGTAALLEHRARRVTYHPADPFEQQFWVTAGDPIGRI